jgi:hypothetical protein
MVSPRAERRAKHSRCMDYLIKLALFRVTQLLYQCSRHISRSQPISRSPDLYLQIYRSVSSFSERRRREALRMIGTSRSTQKTVCESVGITRIQPTLKSFRVDTSDVVTLQAVERWKNYAAQDSSESSPASSGCARQMRIRRARMQNVGGCNHVRMR